MDGCRFLLHVSLPQPPSPPATQPPAPSPQPPAPPPPRPFAHPSGGHAPKMGPVSLATCLTQLDVTVNKAISSVLRVSVYPIHNPQAWNAPRGHGRLPNGRYFLLLIWKFSMHRKLLISGDTCTPTTPGNWPVWTDTMNHHLVKKNGDIQRIYKMYL